MSQSLNVWLSKQTYIFSRLWVRSDDWPSILQVHSQTLTYAIFSQLVRDHCAAAELKDLAGLNPVSIGRAWAF